MDFDGTAWQRLMDQAHKIWIVTEDYREALFLCTGPERVAMVLGHLNYQVNNGGFAQWVCNGYARGIGDAIAAVRLVAAAAVKVDAAVAIGPELLTPNTAAVIGNELAARLKALRRYVQDEDRGPGYGDYIREGMERRFGRHADECDAWYYANNAAWTAAVERFLSAYAPK